MDVSYKKRENAEGLSQYVPSPEAAQVLMSGKILSCGEELDEMVERIVHTLFSVEKDFGTCSEERQNMSAELTEYIVGKYLIPGTPLMTNAGRHHPMALSSCTVIPVDLRALNGGAAAQLRAYYQQNMGSGFDFTPYDDPVALLSWLNDFAASETATGRYERYIGNMGLLHVSHPRIKEFITAKRDREMRHFNISVDASQHFMEQVECERPFELADGTIVDAAELFQSIAENAWYNGDPGIIFLERMNADNPLAGMSNYVSTPPCAEMGLAEGETSVFAYINLYRLVRRGATGASIDYERLGRITRLATRALDNAIELSLPHFPTKLSARLARLKRKMGIGVCGLADMLIALKLPYDSQEARQLARDVLSFVNYTSKCTSVELARQRGSCEGMQYVQCNRYLSGSLIEDKYVPYPTRTVSAGEWQQLAETIRTTGRLRNISTTALAPTGRSSRLLDVTSAIEPLFSVHDGKGNLPPCVIELLLSVETIGQQGIERIRQQAVESGSFQALEAIPPALRACLKTAKEIAPLEHLRMVADLAGVYGAVDESASKTVNLPSCTSVDEVKEILLAAYRLGVKNISVYRDKTLTDQPVSM